LACSLLHRGGQSFCLPAAQVTLILGRKLRRHHGGWPLYFLDLRDDAIRYKGRRVWQTGARRVADYILAHVSEPDLDRLDRDAWKLWARYVAACRDLGQTIAQAPPSFWRHGQAYEPPWLAQAQADLQLAATS
jgi:hypothetical protein